MALGVAILGATGSIGRSAIAVLDRHPEAFRVVALTANRDREALAGLVDRFHPELVALVNGGEAAEGWRTGRQALLDAARHPDVDVVLNAIVGAAGLEATLVALEAGKRLALANKESLVAGGPLVLKALRRGGGELIPVDSEHSAILQCVRRFHDTSLRRLILTASGGAFRDWDAERLARATPEDALNHPTWDMGAKITVDSATLANKALEVIEAHYLFGVDYDHVDVVVHPQSIIHSMVEFVDGSVLAQLGFPTMELPLLYALTHPDRLPDDGTRFDPLAASSLTFEPVDTERFPTFALGVEAGRVGGTAPAVFNAANEEAVGAFLDHQLPFPGIAEAIRHALDTVPVRDVDALETVKAVDREARTATRTLIERRA